MPLIRSNIFANLIIILRTVRDLLMDGDNSKRLGDIEAIFL